MRADCEAGMRGIVTQKEERRQCWGERDSRGTAAMISALGPLRAWGSSRAGQNDNRRGRFLKQLPGSRRAQRGALLASWTLGICHEGLATIAAVACPCGMA